MAYALAIQNTVHVVTHIRHVHRVHWYSRQYANGRTHTRTYQAHTRVARTQRRCGVRHWVILANCMRCVRFTKALIDVASNQFYWTELLKYIFFFCKNVRGKRLYKDLATL